MMIIYLIIILIIIIFVHTLPSLQHIEEPFATENATNFARIIKIEFDLEPHNERAMQAIDDIFKETQPNYISVISHLKSTYVQKSLNDFNSENVYNTIARAFANKNSSVRVDAQTYYAQYLNNYTSLHREYIYSALGAFVQSKKKNGIRTIEHLKRSLTALEAQQYNIIMSEFYRKYIYDDISSNRLHPLYDFRDQTFQNYFTSSNIDDSAIREYFNAVKNHLMGRINQRATSYADQQEFMRLFLKALGIFTLFENKIDDFIVELLNNDNKCFIQNNGEMNVKMRPCGIYFTPKKNMCDMFEDIYMLSNFQLQMLLNYAQKLRQYTIRDVAKQIDIFDQAFLDIINNNRKEILTAESLNEDVSAAFLNVLKVHYGESITIPVANDVIKSIIKNIYGTTVKYNKKEYNVLDLYRIREQKLKKGIQICKLKLPELKEIDSEVSPLYTQTREKKVHEHNHANPPELWGSCFYNLNSNQLNEMSRRMITNDMKMKYNLLPSCDENIIENIKCKEGCVLNTQNKYLAFDTSAFDYRNTKLIINEGINIPNNLIFMKITPNLQTYKFMISFVIFDNVNKRFIEMSNITHLNNVVRDNLFTIKQASDRFAVGPNKSEKQVYACFFYNGILHTYSKRGVTFSLAEHFNIKNITLGKNSAYTNIQKNIHLLSQIANCANVKSYDNNYVKTKDCLNNIKDLLNAYILDMLKRVLNGFLNEKQYFQGLINGVDADISRKQSEYYSNCDAPHIKNLVNTYITTINAYDRQLSDKRQSLKQFENDKYYWENVYQARWWLPWEWIHKIKMINDRKWDIDNVNKEISSLNAQRTNTQTAYDIIDRRCKKISTDISNLNNLKNAGHRHINNAIEPKIAGANHNINRYHWQDPQYFMQNIETYEIRWINFVDYIKTYNNKGTITREFYSDFFAKMYDERFISSNDNAIYIQVN